MALVLSEKYTKARLGKPWLGRFYLSRYLRIGACHRGARSPGDLHPLQDGCGNRALPLNNLAWSLGVELTFYAIAPYLLRRTNRQLLALALLAMLLKIYAIVRLDNDLPYRLFPLVFIDFLLGVVAYRMRSVLIHLGGRHGPVIGYCLMLALTAALPLGLTDYNTHSCR